MACFSVAA